MPAAIADHIEIGDGIVGVEADAASGADEKLVGAGGNKSPRLGIGPDKRALVARPARIARKAGARCRQGVACRANDGFIAAGPGVIATGTASEAAGRAVVAACCGLVAARGARRTSRVIAESSGYRARVAGGVIEPSPANRAVGVCGGIGFTASDCAAG